MTALTPIHALECKSEGSAAAFCFIHESSCCTGETVLGLHSTHCSGVLAGSVPLSQGQEGGSSVPGPGQDGTIPQDWEGWSSVPALESLKPYKKYLKVLPKPFDFAPRIGGGSHGQLDLKGLVKKNP